MARWIALSDRDSRAPPGDDAGSLQRGAFVLELSLPLTGPVVLLDYRMGGNGFSLFLDPGAGLNLLHRQGGAMHRARLEGPLPQKGGTARLTLRWDAPAGTATLTYQAGSDQPALHSRSVAPLPMVMADVRALCRGQGVAQRHPAVLWFGVLTGDSPPQHAPWIGRRTPIATPAGLRLAGSLRAGDAVLTRDAGARPLLSVRRMELPSLGSFTPVLLRAPYFATGTDLLVSADQAIALAGAEVEYLFGEDEVLAEARHLIDTRSALYETRRATTACVSLDTGAADLILSEGIALAGADHGGARPLPRRLLRGYETVPLLALLGRGGRRHAA